MKGLGIPSQTQTQGTVSRDSAAMEEACAWATSTHSGWVAAECGIQRNENATVNYYVPFFPVMQANHIPPPPDKCMLHVVNTCL